MKLSISTNHTENMLGYCYLAFYQIFLPSLLGIGAAVLGGISPSLLNIIFFTINFVAVAIIFRRFLWKSVLALRGNWKRCLTSTAMGLGVYFAGMFLISLMIPWIDPNFSNVNDDTILELTQEYKVPLGVCIVLLVPVVEETLFRGLVFRHLFEKDSRLGYLVSMAVFSLIHIVGYIGTTDFRTLLLCFIQYIPAGFALAGAYERAENICAPIATHMTINLIGFVFSR